MLAIIAFITALTFVASFIGVVSGFGTGTYMAPLILFGIPYQQALFFVCIVHWFHDIWKTGLFFRSINLPLVIYFGLPALVASYAGALVVVSDSSAHLVQVLGVFLIIYAAFLLAHPTFIIPATKTAVGAGGVISGFLAGIFGMRGAIKSSFLSAFNLPPEEYVATMGATSILIDTARMFAYWYGGIQLPPTLQGALWFAVPASFLGAFVGSRVVYRVPQEKFRSFVAVCILLVGVWILLVMRPGVLL